MERLQTSEVWYVDRDAVSSETIDYEVDCKPRHMTIGPCIAASKEYVVAHVRLS
jgi:hypothetical protein